MGNTGNATNNMNKIVQTATQYMSNLGSVAANLASTMNTAVANAIAQGSINIQGITTAAQNFNTAIHKTGGELNTTTSGPLKSFITQLYNAGQPLSDTKAIIDQILTRMGDSPAEIAIWNKAIDPCTPIRRMLPIRLSIRLKLSSRRSTACTGKPSPFRSTPAAISSGRLARR